MPTKKSSRPRRQAAFLDAYKITGSVCRAAKAAGIDRSTHAKWLADPDYVQRFSDANEQAIDTLAQEARRRAVDGVRRLKFYKGEAVMVPLIGSDGKPRFNASGEPILVPYVEHEFSDTLLIFLLKAADPERYRERSEHRIDGSIQHAGQVDVRVVLSELENDPRWTTYARQAEAARFRKPSTN